MGQPPSSTSAILSSLAPGLVVDEALVDHRQPAQRLLESRRLAHMPPSPPSTIPSSEAPAIAAFSCMSRLRTSASYRHHLHKWFRLVSASWPVWVDFATW